MSPGSTQKAELPEGEKVIPGPLTEAERRLLAEPEIGASGGCRTIEFNHFIGPGGTIHYLFDVFESRDPGGFRIELISIPDLNERPASPKIHSVPLFTCDVKESLATGREIYEQAERRAVLEAKRLASAKLALLGAEHARKNLDRQDFKFDVVDVSSWKMKLREFRDMGRISREWIATVASKAKSKAIRSAMRELIQSPDGGNGEASPQSRKAEAHLPSAP